MRDPHLEDQIVLMLLGELGEAARGEVEVHLGRCDSCRALLEEERRLIESLGERSPSGPPDDLLRRCRRELTGALGIRDSGSAVRAGLVHYNDQADVDRLLAAVAELA